MYKNSIKAKQLAEACYVRQTMFKARGKWKQDTQEVNRKRQVVNRDSLLMVSPLVKQASGKAFSPSLSLSFICNEKRKCIYSAPVYLFNDLHYWLMNKRSVGGLKLDLDCLIHCKESFKAFCRLRISCFSRSLTFITTDSLDELWWCKFARLTRGRVGQQEG